MECNRSSQRQVISGKLRAMHETYPNGVSQHALQASTFGPDVLEANMVPIK